MPFDFRLRKARRRRHDSFWTKKPVQRRRRIERVTSSAEAKRLGRDSGVFKADHAGFSRADGNLLHASVAAHWRRHKRLAQRLRVSPDSVSRFPDQPALAVLMRDAGFDEVAFENLTGGIAALHTGRRR